MRADPELGPYVERHGPLTVEPAEDFFERFVVSIVRQQVSIEAAAAIRERLFDAVTITPAGVLAADDATLRAAGLSARKVEYVRNVARAFEERCYSLAAFEDKSDEAVIEELTSITGVGAWTARMQLIFSLGRPDVFPVGDLGIRRAMSSLYEASDREEMVERSRSWSPYRSYASLYLWRTEDEPMV